MVKHAEMSNAELAFRLRKLGRHAPQWLAVVADRLEGMPADPVPVPQGEPVAWRVWAKGGRFTRGIYENPTRETFDCWAADGDTLEPLYAAQGAKP